MDLASLRTLQDEGEYQAALKRRNPLPALRRRCISTRSYC